jgi:hypothetical protein
MTDADLDDFAIRWRDEVNGRDVTDTLDASWSPNTTQQD